MSTGQSSDHVVIFGIRFPLPPSAVNAGNGNNQASYDEDSDDDPDFLTSLLRDTFGPPSQSPQTGPEELPCLFLNDESWNDDYERYARQYGAELPEGVQHDNWPGNSLLRVRGPVHFLEWTRLQSIMGLLKIGQHAIKVHPYDPTHAHVLAICYSRLSYPDIAVGYAYQCIELMQALARRPAAGVLLDHEDPSPFSNMDPREKVQIFNDLGRSCMKLLIFGVLDCLDVESALAELKSYKATNQLHDPDLDNVLTALLNDSKAAWVKVPPGASITPKAIRDSHCGVLWKRDYPWLDKRLTTRTLNQLESWISNFPSRNATIVPVNLLPTKEDVAARGAIHEGSFNEENLGTPFPLVTKELRDCGSLGVMATKDICKGEVILFDPTITAVSNIRPMEHCDACLATLTGPNGHNRSIKIPNCGCQIAFCSAECMEIAMAGYHEVLCGKNFDWLYRDISQGSKIHSSWGTLLFLRIVAVILADTRNIREEDVTLSEWYAGDADGRYKCHPLLHPVLARLTAGYAEESTVPWHFEKDVKVPFKILQQLGVDMWKDHHWCPETIRTMIIRVGNNGHCGSTTRTVGNIDTGKIEEKEWDMSALCSNFIFFNHNCYPNVAWMTSAFLDQYFRSDPHDKIPETVKAGCSTLICRAMRNIRSGEQLFVAYIQDNESAEAREKTLAGYGISCDCGKCKGRVFTPPDIVLRGAKARAILGDSDDSGASDISDDADNAGASGDSDDAIDSGASGYPALPGDSASSGAAPPSGASGPSSASTPSGASGPSGASSPGASTPFGASGPSAVSSPGNSGGSGASVDNQSLHDSDGSSLIDLDLRLDESPASHEDSDDSLATLEALDKFLAAQEELGESSASQEELDKSSASQEELGKSSASEEKN